MTHMYISIAYIIVRLTSYLSYLLPLLPLTSYLSYLLPLTSLTSYPFSVLKPGAPRIRRLRYNITSPF